MQTFGGRKGFGVAVILCIDVGPALAGTLEQHLRDLNHEPVHAPSVGAAILALQDRHFDLAILDTSVRERDGSQFLHHLRDAGIRVPTIVLADFSSPDHAMEALTHGAADYVTTPLRAESVRIAVTNALEIDRLRKETQEARGGAASPRGHSVVERPPTTRQDELIPPPESMNGEVLNLHELEAIAIRQALKKTGGHRIKAAELLGINERTLRNKLKMDAFRDLVPSRPSNGAPRR